MELRRGRPGIRSALVAGVDGGPRHRGQGETISIEHEDPFAAPEIGIPQAARLLAEAIGSAARASVTA